MIVACTGLPVVAAVAGGAGVERHLQPLSVGAFLLEVELHFLKRGSDMSTAKGPACSVEVNRFDGEINSCCKTRSDTDDTYSYGTPRHASPGCCAARQ